MYLTNSINFIKNYDMQITLVPWKGKEHDGISDHQKTNLGKHLLYLPYLELFDHSQHQQIDP